MYWHGSNNVKLGTLKTLIYIVLFLVVFSMIIWIMVSSVNDPGVVVYLAVALFLYLLIRRVILRQYRRNRGGASVVSSRQSCQDSDSGDMNK